MSGHASTELDFAEALAAFDSAFERGNREMFGSFLSDEVELHWNEQATIRGQREVAAAFGALFDSFDTSAWNPTHHTVDVYADAAYVMSDFTETLRPLDGAPAIMINGRLVLFWRLEVDDWKLTRILTARSESDESSD